MKRIWLRCQVLVNVMHKNSHAIVSLLLFLITNTGGRGQKSLSHQSSLSVKWCRAVLEGQREEVTCVQSGQCSKRGFPDCQFSQTLTYHLALCWEPGGKQTPDIICSLMACHREKCFKVLILKD